MPQLRTDTLVAAYDFRLDLCQTATTVTRGLHRESLVTLLFSIDLHS